MPHNLTDAVLDSWRRNAAMVASLAEAVQPHQLAYRVAEGEQDIAEHLCHIHAVRRGWLASVDPAILAGTERLHVQVGDDWQAVRDLGTIRARLPESAALIEKTVGDALRTEAAKLGPYDHPVLLLQHMLCTKAGTSAPSWPPCA